MAENDGTVWCWDAGNIGQLGTGTSNSSTPLVVTIDGGKLAVAFRAGSQHTCAATCDGNAHFWGRNFSGQLGNSLTTDTSVPQKVGGWPP